METLSVNVAKAEKSQNFDSKVGVLEMTYAEIKAIVINWGITMVLSVIYNGQSAAKPTLICGDVHRV